MNRTGRRISSLVAAAALVPCSSARAAAVDELADRVDAWLAPLVEAGELSGTVLLARGDEVLYERAFGLANEEHGIANTPTTRHCVASVTKPMTIAIAGRLIETGALGLDDTLDEWIADFPGGDRITVEHLLRHQAGVPHRVTTPEEETRPRTAADMVALARDAGLAFEPGSATAYSSAGYSVLARVLELAGGAAYGELLDELVCQPAELTRTTHADARALLADRAQDYLPALDGWRNAPLRDYSFLVGAGSVYSTASDLFRFQRAALGGRFGATVREALWRGQSRVHWNGQTGGFRAFADHDAATDHTVVLVANRVSGANELVRAAAPRLLAGERLEAPHVPERTAVDVDAAVLRSYEGVYRPRSGSDLELRYENGAVFAGDWILIPRAPGRLFSPQDYGEVEVLVADDGTVTGLSWAGQPMSRVSVPRRVSPPRGDEHPRDRDDDERRVAPL